MTTDEKGTLGEAARKSTAVIVPSLSSNNEVLWTEDSATQRMLKEKKLSAISFEIEDASETDQKQLLDWIIKKLNQNESFIGWLLVCDGAWVKDNRVVQYYKIWKFLKMKGLHLIGEERLEEIAIKNNEKVRYFSALKKPECSKTNLNFLLREGSGRFGRFTLFFVPKKKFFTNIELVRKSRPLAFVKESDDAIQWSQVASIICGNENVLVRPFGFFDDKKSGFDLLFHRDLLEPLSEIFELEKKTDIRCR